ncbi:uncharacterized protein YoxC [Paenibacillus shirakamiensis]|uniref:Uncharacterized protein YoxC n=1 Tax=Paenibacillus shirakamiensis TaxID=1265935 RepID=A0ABS4JJU6_9BACL|nr:DUF948 domain-containing protein [Paenibacillus shirakamiensis]MBP2001984.1 uncharacterized protein YoxC [Paenibacillus shirakamiensis]
MDFQTSVTLIAVAFAALVLFGILTLRKLMASLDETNKTLGEVRGAVHGLTSEAQRLIRNANQVTADVKGKMRAVDPIVETAQDVGEVLHSVTDSVKQAVSVIGQKVQEQRQQKVNLRVKK